MTASRPRPQYHRDCPILAAFARKLGEPRPLNTRDTDAAQTQRAFQLADRALRAWAPAAVDRCRHPELGQLLRRLPKLEVDVNTDGLREDVAHVSRRLMEDTSAPGLEQREAAFCAVSSALMAAESAAEGRFKEAAWVSAMAALYACKLDPDVRADAVKLLTRLATRARWNRQALRAAKPAP